jgi:Holliday junction resolvasome RuvABC DNA-binding subunit
MAAADARASSQSVYDDTVEALVSLGYQKSQAEKVVKRVLEQEQDHTIEHILRQALKHLSR